MIKTALDMLKDERGRIDNAIKVLKDTKYKAPYGLFKRENETPRLHKMKRERTKSHLNRTQILSILNEHRNGLSTLDISSKLNIPYNTVWSNLTRLEMRKRVSRRGTDGGKVWLIFNED